MTGPAWRIAFAAATEEDLVLIHDHLVDSYLSFGDSGQDAAQRAAARLEQILDEAERIATAPHRGSRHDDLLPGLRLLTLARASYWFTLDEPSARIRILALFFGPLDQHRRMLIRMLERTHD